MKREISPATMGIVIAIVVIVIGVFFYRKAVVNPPSAHPQYGGSAPNASTTSPATPAGQ
jgi:cytoskeletal protein RodZ